MKLFRYIVWEIAASKIIIGFSLFLFAISFGMFTFNDDPVKTISSLLNIVLIVLPLFSIVFSTIYFYNSYEFTELLLAQPVRRSHLFISQYLGLSLSLSIAFLLGCGLPVLMFHSDSTGLFLLTGGISLIFVFVALASAGFVISKDKARGIGTSLLLWFYFVFIYDALVLMILFGLSDYPIEHFVLFLAFLNPVDLIRIILLIRLDNAAIMGYSGALFNEFLGSSNGIIACTSAILAWIAAPLIFSVKQFLKKDI